MGIFLQEQGGRKQFQLLTPNPETLKRKLNLVTLKKMFARKKDCQQCKEKQKLGKILKFVTKG